MNKNLIPKKIHHLITLVNEWGITDDGERDAKVYNSDIKTLKKLVAHFTDEVVTDINKFLDDLKEMKEPSEEYVKFNAFYMACAYAREELKGRKIKKK